MAAMVSPPPAIENAGGGCVMAAAMALVPPAQNCSNSNTPTGPFRNNGACFRQHRSEFRGTLRSDVENHVVVSDPVDRLWSMPTPWRQTPSHTRHLSAAARFAPRAICRDDLAGFGNDQLPPATCRWAPLRFQKCVGDTAHDDSWSTCQPANRGVWSTPSTPRQWRPAVAGNAERAAQRFASPAISGRRRRPARKRAMPSVVARRDARLPKASLA